MPRDDPPTPVGTPRDDYPTHARRYPDHSTARAVPAHRRTTTLAITAPHRPDDSAPRRPPALTTNHRRSRRYRLTSPRKPTRHQPADISPPPNIEPTHSTCPRSYSARAPSPLARHPRPSDTPAPRNATRAASSDLALPRLPDQPTLRPATPHPLTTTPRRSALSWSLRHHNAPRLMPIPRVRHRAVAPRCKPC